MKSILREDWLSISVICLFSTLFVADLFLNIGQSANMDGIVHMITPNLFAHSLAAGNIPVSWIDNFANYGLPLGVIAQQLSTYLTAIIILITSNPVLAFNIMIFVGVLLSHFFYYLFLRCYFSPFYSMIGVFLFTLAPYRILNIYIRGAMPEFFAAVFMPLLLLAMYLLIEKKNVSGLFLLILSTAALVLTHPFMLVVSSIVLFPYILFLFYKNTENLKTLYFQKKTWVLSFLTVTGLVLGIGIAGYYLLPLTREIKYFYYGLHPNHLTADNYLSWNNFFGKEWFFFTPGDVFARGFFISVGIVETILLLIASSYLLWKWKSRNGRVLTIFEFSLFISFLYLFFVTKYADPLYEQVHILSNIQFPWRMLSGFILIFPIAVVYLLERVNRKWVALVLLFVLLTLRFPQLYGKNYTLYPLSHYDFTNYNLHATAMNPIWSGRSEDYPVKTQKGEIIEGRGTVKSLVINDTLHSYTVNAQTHLHMIDNTFYFPGWNLYIDNKKSEIQYQDPAYRGVITYTVPPGNHVATLRFEDTTIRKVGKGITVFTLFVFAVLIFYRKKIQNLLAGY